MRRTATIAAALLAGACATPEPPTQVSEPAQGAAPAPAPATATKAKPPRIESVPLKHLVGRNLKPIPDRPLEVRTRCAFRDVGGGRGSMDLLVNQAEVKRFVAEVSIPKQGMCRFDMKQFQQTAKLPNVVLNDARDGCTVRMWEQEKGVTVSFNGCKSKCSGDAFSYLWPIFVDTRNGRCA